MVIKMIKLNSDDILLFQGDSITHGGRVYSDWDMNHIMGHGYQSILASRIGLENIDTRPKIINRGVSGDTSLALLNRWDEDCIKLKPTILSILVGINDAFAKMQGNEKFTPDFYFDTYKKLIEKTLSSLPGIKLIIGEPFHFTCTDENSDSEKREYEKRFTDISFDYAQKARLIAKEYNALFVEYRNEFVKYLDTVPLKYLVWDGVHPTYTGHEILAEKWYGEVEKYLSKQ